MLMPAPAPVGFASLILVDCLALFAEFRMKRFWLLWRGSRDGFDARDFHNRADRVTDLWHGEHFQRTSARGVEMQIRQQFLKGRSERNPDPNKQSHNPLLSLSISDNRSRKLLRCIRHTRKLFSLEASGRPPEKGPNCVMRGFAAASFIPFPLLVSRFAPTNHRRVCPENQSSARAVPALDPAHARRHEGAVVPVRCLSSARAANSTRRAAAPPS
jgi:hypothetical protein